ncbi:MAG: nickel pincer cofactor biosynthesis protein LarC [Lachnospiraceae bacterium]|nr:nickel pincer cofactor biosynthesis protein LarC [Lachnospiraceae bacterium]
MRILYIDCGMGAAGDMLGAALLELLPDREGFIEKLNGLGIPGVRFAAEPSVKCGITGTHMRVTVDGCEEGCEEHEHDHEHHHDHGHEHHHEHDHGHEHHHDHDHEHHHHHASMRDIGEIVDALPVSDRVRADIMAVYGLIAQAEGRAHGGPVEEIHFHEVGTMDAVADVTAVCLLMEELSPAKVLASPVHVGCGSVRCAHGILPVPAPATADILKGVPIYGGRIEGELCTPTGAALLKHFVSDFGDMPVMKVETIGLGMGKKDFERANCVRAMLGETQDSAQEMLMLSCNVDDMTAEDIAYACSTLLAAGANEVFTVPAGMKKSRTGTVITVICDGGKREELLKVMFTHTSTLGIREIPFKRNVLKRRIVAENTPFGEVRKKISEGYGVVREKYEHDDLERIAKENGLSIEQVRRRLSER